MIYQSATCEYVRTTTYECTYIRLCGGNTLKIDFLLLQPLVRSFLFVFNFHHAHHSSFFFQCMHVYFCVVCRVQRIAKDAAANPRCDQIYDLNKNEVFGREREKKMIFKIQ